MSFQQRSETLQARLHLGNVKPAVLIALIALAAAVLAALVVGVDSTVAGGGFSIECSAPVVNGVSGADAAGELAESFAGETSGDAPADVPALSEPTHLCVHVSGSVARPGVYYLEEGARVYQAIEAAGGLSEDAYRDYVNEARVISDGEHLVIPSVEDIENAQAAGASAWQGGEGSALSGVPGSSLININTATVEELVRLDGVGEATAKKIIAYREANGPFAAVEDLTLVSGIGEKRLAAIIDHICV